MSKKHLESNAHTKWKRTSFFKSVNSVKKDKNFTSNFTSKDDGLSPADLLISKKMTLTYQSIHTNIKIILRQEK
jgi:hypothetical protein